MPIASSLGHRGRVATPAACRLTRVAAEAEPPQEALDTVILLGLDPTGVALGAFRLPRLLGGNLPMAGPTPEHLIAPPLIQRFSGSQSMLVGN